MFVHPSHGGDSVIVTMLRRRQMGGSPAVAPLLPVQVYGRFQQCGAPKFLLPFTFRGCFPAFPCRRMLSPDSNARSRSSCVFLPVAHAALVSALCLLPAAAVAVVPYRFA